MRQRVDFFTSEQTLLRERHSNLLLRDPSPDSRRPSPRINTNRRVTSKINYKSVVTDGRPFTTTGTLDNERDTGFDGPLHGLLYVCLYCGEDDGGGDLAGNVGPSLRVLLEGPVGGVVEDFAIWGYDCL